MIQSSISVALIRPLIDAVSSKAPVTEPESAIDVRLVKLLKDPDARISMQDADELINSLVRTSRSNSLCVFSAQKAVTQSSCQLQHLFLCSNTLREALYYLEKYSALLSDNLEVNVTRTRDNIIKIKLPVSEQSFLSQERYRSELLMVSIYRFHSQAILRIIRICGKQTSPSIQWNAPFSFKRAI